MDDDFMRRTAPGGDLSKPPRKPPTAVGTDTLPNPDDFLRRFVRSRPRRRWYTRLLRRTFDAIDDLGDALARKLHLRQPRTRTSK
jgi:hypothetical protein